ncbi:hypothetical protein [Halobaculum sp. MBLA0143]
MRETLSNYGSAYGTRVLLLLVVLAVVSLAAEPAAAKYTCPEWYVHC